MIDVAKIKYKVLLLMSNDKLDITNAAESIDWEENERELAVRINLTLRNMKYKNKNLTGLIKLNSVIAIMANCGTGYIEVARGNVVDWRHEISNPKKELSIVCYDNLYNLQKSQENVFFPSGTGTKSAIESLFKKINMKVDSYNGPNAKHSKMVYKSKNVSDIILDILDDAVKKGSENYIIRSTKGKIQILKRGGNKDVYHFDKSNTISATASYSTADMVTKVKIISQTKDKSRVEATIEGRTEFGIRQKIHVRDKDTSLAEAKKAANKILKDDGRMDKKSSVQVPDIPTIRKGDLIYLMIGSMTGYYYVLGVQHSAGNGTMNIDVIKKEGA